MRPTVRTVPGCLRSPAVTNLIFPKFVKLKLGAGGAGGAFVQVKSAAGKRILLRRDEFGVRGFMAPDHSVIALSVYLHVPQRAEKVNGLICTPVFPLAPEITRETRSGLVTPFLFTPRGGLATISRRGKAKVLTVA